MKIFLATDHAGFELKEKVKAFLQKEGFEMEDCGALTFDKNDDYPDFISKAAEAISKNPDEDKGIVFGGSGQAEMIVANKYKGVRCALFYSAVAPIGAADVTGRISTDSYEMIRLTREHNDANMLSLGARFINDSEAFEVVKLWLATPFSNEERHRRRIEKIKNLES